MKLVWWDPAQTDSYPPRAENSLGALLPPVANYERHDRPVIRAEVLDVRIEDDAPTRQGEREQDTDLNDENAHLMERDYGAFTWSFSLPARVEAARPKRIELKAV